MDLLRTISSSTDSICISQYTYVTSTSDIANIVETCSKPLNTYMIYLIDFILIVFVSWLIMNFFKKKIL